MGPLLPVSKRFHWLASTSNFQTSRKTPAPSQPQRFKRKCFFIQKSVEFRGTYKTIGFWIHFPTACWTWGFGTWFPELSIFKFTISGTCAREHRRLCEAHQYTYAMVMENSPKRTCFLQKVHGWNHTSVGLKLLTYNVLLITHVIAATRYPFITLIGSLMAPVSFAGERSEEGTYEAYQPMAWNQPACQPCTACTGEPRHWREKQW